MNRTFRFVMAGLLALLVIAGAASVWASPSRQGTVPVPPPEGGGGGGDTSCEKVDMIKVVFTIFPPDDKKYECLATNITTPTPDEYGPAPENFAFYSDIFKFEVTLDNAPVVEIPTQVCYAYPPEFEEKEAMIFIWDADANEWKIIPGDGNGVPDGGLASGDPKQICVTSPTTGIFSLIGKP
ncbi:MAG: hypothetical protein HY863_17205 [Chloroflexi bacterium]|nr:hypothetical protein [Chloroflexota bacterium]